MRSMRRVHIEGEPTPRKRAPHEFVLEALSGLPVLTRPMFGCVAVYLGEKIMLLLRDRTVHRAVFF